MYSILLELKSLQKREKTKNENKEEKQNQRSSLVANPVGSLCFCFSKISSKCKCFRRFQNVLRLQDILIKKLEALGEFFHSSQITKSLCKIFARAGTSSMWRYCVFQNSHIVSIKKRAEQEKYSLVRAPQKITSKNNITEVVFDPLSHMYQIVFQNTPL